MYLKYQKLITGVWQKKMTTVAKEGNIKETEVAAEVATLDNKAAVEEARRTLRWKLQVLDSGLFHGLKCWLVYLAV